MYFKLAIRNAKRSIRDYLLYVTTMTILIAIMTVSNYMAVVGKIQAGFQTISLPLIIMLILVILTGYSNRFLLKQRAKEFANYLLLGMERSKLSWMFFLEFQAIGLVCFGMGVLIGFGICSTRLSLGAVPISLQATFFPQSLLYSFVSFCVVEFLAAFPIKRSIDKLEIRELMMDKKRNQIVEGKNQSRLWGGISGISLLILLFLFFCIVFLPLYRTYKLISFIAIPLLIFVFTFYKWFYSYLIKIRQRQSKYYYQDYRLYPLAQMTSETKTSAMMNSIFCICLLFSVMSFAFGVIMLQSEIILFNPESQKWMGFLQISLSIIFIVIYFSIVSLQQLITLRRRANDIQILYTLGIGKIQLNGLIKKQIIMQWFLPALLYTVLMLIATPLLNYKLNLELPVRNILLKSVNWFSVCFLFLFFCYFTVVCVAGRHYIDHSIN